MQGTCSVDFSALDEIEHPLAVATEFLCSELCAARMVIVVVLDIRVAIEADQNPIASSAWPTLGFRYYAIDFDVSATLLATDTAVSATSHEQFFFDFRCRQSDPAASTERPSLYP